VSKLQAVLCPPQVWLLKYDDAGTVPIIWTICTMIANFAICFLGWWRCFANNYLHWAAGTTWLLLIVQGNSANTISLSLSLALSIHVYSCLHHSIRSFVWVWNLVCHIEGRTQVEGKRE
jgi:hypothetical protein